MKIRRKIAITLCALLMTSGTFPVYAASSGGQPQSAVPSQADASTTDIFPGQEQETVSSGNLMPSPGDTTGQEPSVGDTESPDAAVPEEAPEFSAQVVYFDGQGYIARGTLTQFLPNTRLVRTLYSLDGETWQTGGMTWDLKWLGSGIEENLNALRTQHCILGSQEPLSSYLDGKLDRFYLKLQITLENGNTYETQAALIDRGEPRPVPEEYTLVADYVPAMRIRQWRPFLSYGQYQMTVRADAAPKDISALLPDTLPINIQIYSGINFVSDATVECPVTWKPLAPARLTPGESVTVADAAEEIIVPAGTLLHTPTGTFRLDEPLGFEHDEIRLVLNAVAEDARPTGVLKGWFEGLEISFDLKPTGATAIRAYTFMEGRTEWVEIPDPLPPEKVNTPSSTAGSLFTFVLKKDSEPYQSWLAAEKAGEEPMPFLVGLKIEGGVYDGQELILPYPYTYEISIQPPKLGGSGGNEGNAGSDNKNDSTSEGQRPNLPQNPEDEPDIQNPVPPQDSDGDMDSQTPLPPQDSDNDTGTMTPLPPQDSDNDTGAMTPLPPQDSDNNTGAMTPLPPQDSDNDTGAHTSLPPQDSHGNADAKTAIPPQDSHGNADAKTVIPPQDSHGDTDAKTAIPSQESRSDTDAQTPLPSQESHRDTDTKTPLPIQDSEHETDAKSAVKTGKEQSGRRRIPRQKPLNREAEQSIGLEGGTGIQAEGKAKKSILIFLYGTVSALGIFITAAAGKIAAGRLSGRLSGKLAHILSRLLHPAE